MFILCENAYYPIYGGILKLLGGIFWIENTQKFFTQDLTKKFITDDIELILNNSNSTTNYIQTFGTVIGTKMAPMYATLHLATSKGKSI